MKKSMKLIIIVISFLLVAFVILFIANHYQKRAFNTYVNKQLKQELQDDSFVIEINRKAPVIVKKQITINAPIEKVWSTLTNIDYWNKWQSSVTKSKLKGELKKGSFFDWEADGLTFESRIHTCTPDSLFGWTGTTIGVQAVHNWRLISVNNTTSIIVEENLQGIVASTFSSLLEKSLSTGMDKNLNELKAFCEK